MQKRVRGVALGAGYFSHFQYEAWTRIPEVEIVALSNRSRERGEEVQKKYGVPRLYSDWKEMIDAEKPDFVDVITPPETHLEVCEFAAKRKIAIICQKPIAPTEEESLKVVKVAREAKVPFMVHENFRWQPWHREIKQLLDAGTIGEIFCLYFKMRMGDGWPEDAYLARQPFFREYPRLLVYETGVHFIDTFRFLAGELTSVYARLRRLNPVIKGEDSGQFMFTLASGGTAILDANRYNEVDAANPRYTFGEMRIDGSKGHILLDTAGNISVKLLGKPTVQHAYKHEAKNFAGDCVYAIQRHFIDCYLAGREPESTGEDYLKNVRLVEACYESAKTGQVVRV